MNLMQADQSAQLQDAGFYCLDANPKLKYDQIWHLFRVRSVYILAYIGWF